MEAAAAAASAAAAAAKDAALAASVAAAAAAKDAAAAAVTAKEATDAAKDAAAAASAAALNAKDAAAAASAAALNAKEAAVKASAAALDAKEAAAVAVTSGQAATAAAAAMQASQKRRFADAELDAEEAAPAAATAGQAAGPINAEEAAALAANAGRPVAAATVAMQAFKKRKFAAVALNYKVPAPATATAGEATPVALQASNKCKFQIIDVDQDPPGSGDVDVDQDPPGSGDVDDAGSADHIGRLPDAVLCSIVSLLPTKEGARTQVISRRWRPLWHSAPLNLVVDQELNSNNHSLVELISKILSVHPGPARRFSLCLSKRNYDGKIKGWLSSHALDKLQEFELIPKGWFDVRDTFYMLPSSVYRFAPTLRVAKFGGCCFSNLIVKLSLKFPCLKQLTLDRVSISEDALQSVLSGCYALESLELKKNSGFRRLCISSQTLKSVGFCTNWLTKTVPLQELVIEDAPCLERLLSLDPQVGPRTIRVISAPKLNILGVLSKSITELQLGTTVSRSMIAVGLTTKMHSVRVLVLDYTNLDIVVNFLKCFPCLERLYVFFWSRMCISNPREYDPPEPIECLELHLKEVLLKNYDGTVPLCIDFAKFFVLNAKVLKEMKITLPYHRQYNWFAKQHRLLRTKDRISQDARIELKCGTNVHFTHNMNTHDLSMADPFDVPSSGCKKCSGSPF